MALSTMAGYALADGTQVQTYRVGDEVEFVTSNPEGDVISTTRLSGVHARNVVRTLEAASRSDIAATSIRLTGSRTTPARFLNR
jgi:hypothetical protein